MAASSAITKNTAAQYNMTILRVGNVYALGRCSVRASVPGDVRELGFD